MDVELVCTSIRVWYGSFFKTTFSERKWSELFGVCVATVADIVCRYFPTVLFSEIQTRYFLAYLSYLSKYPTYDNWIRTFQISGSDYASMILRYYTDEMYRLLDEVRAEARVSNSLIFRSTGTTD